MDNETQMQSYYMIQIGEMRFIELLNLKNIILALPEVMTKLNFICLRDI